MVIREPWSGAQSHEQVNWLSDEPAFYKTHNRDVGWLLAPKTTSHHNERLQATQRTKKIALYGLWSRLGHCSER